MSDQGHNDDPRRRRPAPDDGSAPPGGDLWADEPPGDDAVAALERLQAMSPTAAGPPPASARDAYEQSPAAPALPTPAPRGRRRAAAGRRRTSAVARIAAPAVFLIALIALVSLVYQSGITGDDGATTVTPSPSPTKTKGGGQGTAVAFKKYTVKDGDTLSGIAVRFDTSINDILALNPKMSSSTLVVGTVIKVPKPSPSP